VGTAIERTSRAREAISAPLHSVVRIAARHAGSVMASLILLTGCTTTQTSSSLSIEEETRPTTVSASDLDMAALGRVARVAESSGGDIIDPAQVYRRIAERQPSAPEPRVELGRLFLRRGDLDAAERSFQEALSLAPPMSMHRSAPARFCSPAAAPTTRQTRSVLSSRTIRRTSRP
jgi:Flp pilus assembly protein TadD